jgi:ribosomal protein L37AE/L43A
MGLFQRKPNIGKLEEQKDIEGLRKALTFKNPEIRMKAAAALRRMKATKADKSKPKAKRELEKIGAKKEELKGMKATDNKIWQCPKCDAILEKGGLGTIIISGESTEKLIGGGTCNNCGASFAQSDIYGGKYDYIEPSIKQPETIATKPMQVKIIIFREGQDQPANPERYYQDIVDRKYGKSKIQVDAWRIAGTRSSLTANEVHALYTAGKNAGMLPDFGTPNDEWGGKGPDGRSIIALFFFK